MPMLDLPPIPAPTCALAQLRQAHVSETTQLPQHMPTTGMSGGRAVLRKVPVREGRAVGGTVDLYDAFVATQFPEFCTEPAHAAQLAAAERSELLAHASRDFTEQGPDESLAPRGASATLLLHGACATTTVAHSTLDALAHLAAKRARVVRCAVLAGPDATWYRREVASEHLHAPPPPADAELAIRWAVDGAGWEPTLRTEVVPLDLSGAAGSPLCVLQTALMRVSYHCGAPLPADIAADYGNVVLGEWHTQQRRVAADFFATMEGTPSVTRSAPDVDLAPTAVHVRIWPRGRGNEGVSDPGAFHALLLCRSPHVAEVTERCSADFAHGLPADPEHPDLQRLALHTCGAQAEGFTLRELVTLYARGNTPGTPISAPGSWLWRFEPAIVPYVRLAQLFYVVPCTHKSVLPGDTRLVPAFSAFYQRAMDLGYSTFGNTRQEAGDAAETLPAELSSVEDVDTGEAERRRWAATALGVQPSTRRAAIGDVYTWLHRQAAPTELVAFAREAALRFGVGVPLLDVYRRTSRLLAGDEEAAVAAAHRAAVARARRVADAALGIAANEHAKRSQSLQTQVLCSPQRLDAVLDASGGRRLGHSVLMLQSVLADGKGNRTDICDRAVDLIADATGHEDADTELRADAARAALRHRASGPVAMVATMLAELRGAQELRTRVVLVVLDALVNGTAPCTVHTFGEDGVCTPATLGAVVDNADAATAVLVVKRGDAAFARSLDRVYLTTTQAADAADPLQTA